MNRTARCAFAVVKRTATGGPLPSPNVYCLPAAVVTVRDPRRMKRRKNIASNWSNVRLHARLTHMRHDKFGDRRVTEPQPASRLPSLKQNPR